MASNQTLQFQLTLIWHNTVIQLYGAHLLSIVY